MKERIRVILNDRVLFRPLTGVGHYVSQLLAALREEGQSVDVRPFLSGLVRRPRGGGTAPPPSGRVEARGLRNAWWIRRLAQRVYAAAFRLGARGCRLYHEPNHIPIACGLPTVTTIHDLSVLVHPEWHPDDRVRWYETGFEAGQRQTVRFVAASEFTKGEMVRRLGVPADRVDVTYQAPRAPFRPRAADVVRAALARLRLPRDFFLFVGTLEPRKNIAGLLEAFAALPRDVRRRCPLVLAGGWGWKIELLPAQLASSGVQDDLRVVGYQDDETLACLYSGCTALVWPSFYEGFGLPPLEAMNCGAAVIVSNVTSLPEVVGPAGIQLDPYDTRRWTAAMQDLFEDADAREEWRRRGRERAATFSWQRCAQQTVRCYESALQAAGASAVVGAGFGGK